MARHVSIRNLWKRLDKAFSIFIRRSSADEHGLTTCYTCDKRDHWKSLQCGHYISRGHLATRWDHNNCRVQCYGCNVLRNGNMAIFAYRLRRQLGEHGFSALEEKMYITKKWTRAELIDEIARYKEWEKQDATPDVLPVAQGE